MTRQVSLIPDACNKHNGLVGATLQEHSAAIQPEKLPCLRNSSQTKAQKNKMVNRTEPKTMQDL